MWNSFQRIRYGVIITNKHYLCDHALIIVKRGGKDILLYSVCTELICNQTFFTRDFNNEKSMSKPYTRFPIPSNSRNGVPITNHSLSLVSLIYHQTSFTFNKSPSFSQIIQLAFNIAILLYRFVSDLTYALVTTDKPSNIFGTLQASYQVTVHVGSSTKGSLCQL